MAEPAPTDASTRDRLIAAAALLFWRKGYHGVGVAEILAAAKAPKGSLYHHFPEGKPDLAMAAADWTSAGMLRIIDDAFRDAGSFRDGATTFCHKLAKLFDISDHRDSCPISAMLFDGPEGEAFRAHADGVFRSWTERIAGHAARLGEGPGEAARKAEGLLIAIEGGWTLARARRSSDVLRRLPGQLYA
jgi:TetR/AcrR family transcriptional repressor of lmrAB and yxaGH operons